jgi:hypothetical protein
VRDTPFVAHGDPDIEPGVGSDRDAVAGERSLQRAPALAVDLQGTCEPATAGRIGPEREHYLLKQVAHPSDPERLAGPHP